MMQTFRHRAGLAVIMVATALALGGCYAAAVGGAAAGGYYAGKDERTLGEITDDAGLTSSVKTRLIGDKHIKARHINVDTYRKVVTLHGHVESKWQKRRALRLAKSVKGVRKVVSRLKIIPVK